MSSNTHQLDQKHIDHLTGSAIALDVIAERGYYSLAPGDTTSAADLLSVKPATIKPAMHDGALVIPLRRLGNGTPYAYVVRPDLPVIGRDGKPRKYLYPTGSTNILDALPRYHAALGDPRKPLWLTEGAKKADALSSAFRDAIAVLNMNGVTGWRATNAVGGKVASPDMQDIAFNGREIVVCPDGDYKTKPSVQKAISNLVHYLEARWDVGSVWLCSLPQDPTGDKLGVDDFFAQGGTVAELRGMLQPLMHAQRTTVATFMAHPDTGAALVLPHGYAVIAQRIVKVSDGVGMPQPVYTGAIFVQTTGRDLHSGDHTVTIGWVTEAGVRQRTVPAATLSNKRMFSEQIGGAGTAVHEGNSKAVMTYLGEFIPTNRGAIPERLESTVYGVVGDGVVLADRSIGFDAPVVPLGTPLITVRPAADAYPRALRVVVQEWDVPVFWLTFALSLAGPVIARLRPRRNPVLGLFGESGGGKTTLAQFACGAFGDPEQAPLLGQAARTTIAGLFQTLERLGGLPHLIDEAHMHPKPDQLTASVYQFANGQTYTRGGADGRAIGGGAVSGSLFLCGEAVPEFRHAGAQRRVLFVDTADHPPLGVERESNAGAERAAVLEAAWRAGAGLLAPRVLEPIWRDWAAFKMSVDTYKQDEDLARLGPWRDALAIAAATLEMALETLGLPGFLGADTLTAQWADLLRLGREHTDPAGDAWEAVMLMLAQAKLFDNAEIGSDGGVITPATWEYLEANRGGGVVACRKVGEAHWRIPTGTPQFVERVGKSAAQEFGREWARRGYIDLAPDGKTTRTRDLYPRGQSKVLSSSVDLTPKD